MGVLAGIVGGLFFFLRYQMRLVCWLILLALVVLHIVMNQPVWHLVSRVGAVGGSTGWHRFVLIDSAIKHFNEWYLYGCSVYDVAVWGVHAGDVTNQYILEGVNGGVLSLCLFIVIIVVAFKEIGKAWRLQINYRLIIVWAMGVSLFIHCINFIGVSYFGQIIVIWFLLLAMIESMNNTILTRSHPKTLLKRITIQPS